MNRPQFAARSQASATFVTEELYQFLRAHHKFEAFEGRNRERWSDYSRSVARSYQQTLERRGFARIPAYESQTGEAVFFDQELRQIEGERLQLAQRCHVLKFDQTAFLASVVLSPYETQTLSLGECVMGIGITIDGKQVAIVWGRTQSSGSESQVRHAINGALCNSCSTPAFLELLKTKRSDACVEVFP